jgi:cytoskeletal protein RodZ
MRELEVTQAEQLQQIGTMLREEREKLRMPLEEIAVKTYIPLRLLQALEVGQVERLPEPVFIQGFIRRYADAIGLDGPAISKQFAFDPSPVPAQPAPSAEVISGAAPTAVLPASEPLRATAELPSSAMLDRRRSLIAAGGLGALVMAIAAIALLNAPKQGCESVSSRAKIAERACPDSNSSSPPQSFAQSGSGPPGKPNVQSGSRSSNPTGQRAVEGDG